jgi:hypothetical protein
MSAIQNRACLVAAPVAVLDTTGAQGVTRYVSSASNTSVLVPAAMRGKFYKIKSVGTQTDYAFSIGAAQTLVRNQASALGTGHAAAGDTLTSDEVDPGIIPRTTDDRPIYLNFISSDTNGFVVFRCSETSLA